MKKQNNPAYHFDKLRSRAEELLRNKSRKSALNLADAEVLKLLHELEVRQIELELQNEELVSAKEQLQYAAEKYADLYDRAPSGYFTISRPGNILEINYSGARMLELERLELLNCSFKSFVSNASKADYQQFIERVFNSGNTESCEIELLANNKALRIAYVSGIIDKHKENCLLTAVDVTQRRQEQAELYQSESRYKSLFLANHSVMLLIDPETGAIKDANIAACNFYGWTNAEMCRKNISDINPLSKSEMRAEMQKAKEEKRNHFFFKHRLASGEIREVEVYSGPITFGNSTLLYSMVHDITERRIVEEKLKNSEEKYRSLIESINEVVYEISNTGIIKYVSPSVVRVLGFTPNEVIGTNIISYIHEDDRYTIKERIGQLSERDYSYMEYRYVNKSGEIRWVRSSTIAIIENGNTIGGTGTLSDITERKTIELALKASEEKYSKTFLTSPYAIQITRAGDGKLVEVNEAFTTISGYSREEALQDSTIGLNLWADINERNSVVSIFDVR